MQLCRHHLQAQHHTLLKYLSNVQLQDILEDVKSVEVESCSESVSLCRFFQRGVCNKGSLCEFSHDLTAKRSTCKYFLSETV